MLKGVIWPANGKRVYQEDYQYEQNSISEEIRNRDTENFAHGIVYGGEVSILDEFSGFIQITGILAYNEYGQRIESPEIQLNAPENTDTILVLRHKFNEVVDPSKVDSSGYAVKRRENSYELLFTDSLSTGDIAIAGISRLGSNCTITDARKFKNRLGDLQLIRSRIQSAIPKEALDLVAVLNRIDAQLEAEETARTNAQNSLQNAITSEAQTRSQADTNLQNAITSEAQTRSQADTSLQNAITSEAQARSQADVSLQNAINGKADSGHTHAFEAGKSSELWSWAEGLPDNIYYPPQNHHITGGIVFAMDVTGYYIANNNDHIFSKGYVNGLLQGGNLYVRFFPDRVEAECTVLGGYWCRCLIFISHN
ncbi:MAG: hypothetical protein H7A25_22105 [Leptospiraceae bacterium]|nr:hypothetical protein [Leptospiraceae bacterium]